MLRFFAELRMWSNVVAVGIGSTALGESGSRVTHIATLTMNPHAEGEMSDPTLHLSPLEAKELMDVLWHAGVRPSNGTGNAGQLGATEKHLEDMRKLVFKSTPD